MNIQRPIALAAVLLTASLAQAADGPAECHFTRVAEMPLAYTGPGLQVTTEGTINGVPVTVLVDTGAWDSVLTRTGTNRLALPLHMTTQRARGVGGFSRIYFVRLKEFAFGGAKSINGMFPVLGDTGFSPSFDAIAGAPFLLQADLEINLPEKKMKFFRPQGCQERFLAYWDENASAIPFGYKEGSRITPHFTVQVNGQTLDAMIDTGASTTGIRSRAARRIGLKLDDAARIGSVTGVGDKLVAQWHTTVDKMVIGDETIQDTDIAVFDSDGGPGAPDILLGDDFLRSHRVLFAMSQQKLYISYVGGDPFHRYKELEPWIVQEAESGNSDAQVALARAYYEGRGVPRDPVKADAWMDKAAVAGNPRADLLMGERMLAQHRYGDAAARMHAALQRLPAERYGALSLYLARLQAGQPDLAKTELEASFAQEDHDQWPTPLADFYLGRIDAAALLKAAGDEAAQAKPRTCAANNYMFQLYAARGDNEKAQAAKESWRAQCGPAIQAAQAK
jgi:clan AA aspartic protease (TIGR02281 family)